MAHAGGGGCHLRAFGVVRTGAGDPPRVALRLGDDVLLPETGDADLREALERRSLNALIALGPDAWRAALECDGRRVAPAECEPLLPVQVGDFVDFYASEAHARNFGRLFRPGRPALRDNWYSIPVGYHGRAGSIAVSGTPIVRPQGVIGTDSFAPTRALDFECELGYVCASQTELFGVVIVNDWSARDVQRFEYVPLGPFLGKSFATSVSAWVVPLADLEHARFEPPPQDPSPAPHLRAVRGRALDAALEVELNGQVISRPRAAGLHWTPEQMLAHLTSNGAPVRAGDLFATGTISGAESGTEGSLAEIGGGERWLADGDEVVLRGSAGGVPLGEVRGRILPAAQAGRR